MALVLTAIGLLLLVISLAGVALGSYIATNRSTREDGWLFAVLWVPGLAAASGLLMRDVVTFSVGLLCLLAAGTVFLLRGSTPHKRKTRKDDPPEEPTGARFLSSEETTRENRTSDSGRAAS